VSRADCEAFCKWLTALERDNPNTDLNRITKDFRYRLPTDREWSHMVGLIEVGEGILEREQENPGVFPWGQSFPPPNRMGNYADTSAVQFLENTKIIAGYTDGFARLAPVGSFGPNLLGIHDLGGNVHEWVSDDYPIDSLGILRGGGWNSSTEEHLESRNRYVVPALEKEQQGGRAYGFRVVLAKDFDLGPDLDGDSGNGGN
jgi:formylglycine-generating enzyme required for sulfatase activity